MAQTRRRIAGYATAASLLLCLAVAACGGSGGALSSPGIARDPRPTDTSTVVPSAMGTASAFPGASPTPSVSPVPPSPTPTPVMLERGHVLGQDSLGDGDTPSGGQNKQSVDGIPCGPMATTYHIHAHVSFFVNGTRLAIPDVIGFYNPGSEDYGFTNTAGCVYYIHTHDADGYIHMEAPAVMQFTLGELFDIWGQQLSSTGIAGFSGSVMAYTATAHRGFATKSGPFTQYLGDLRSLQLTSHEEVVLEVGPAFVVPPNIPAVVFDTYY